MAVDFPGDRQFERLTNLPSATTSFTAMAWCKSDDNSSYPVIFDFGADDPTGANNVEFFVSGTAGGIWNGTTYAYGGTFNTGTWYHVALTCAGTGATDLKGWMDGVNVSSMTGASYSAAIFTIGAWPGNFQKFDGKMAGFKLFDTVLTADQIKQEMKSLRVVTSHSNLKAWLPWINNSNFTYDLSGNGSWAEQGTGSFTSVQGPPVSWGAPLPFSTVIAAAAAPTARNLTLLGVG
jgi:hypothetical protein